MRSLQACVGVCAHTLRTRGARLALPLAAGQVNQVELANTDVAVLVLCQGLTG